MIPSGIPRKTVTERGSISACCLVVVFMFIIALIGGVVFYYTTWKVPDYAQETEAVVIRSENRTAQLSSIPDDKNAWTYYKEAADGLDFSKLPTKTSTGNLPGYYTYVEQIRTIMEKGPDKSQAEAVKDLLLANGEMFKKVDKGFSLGRFYNEPVTFQFKPTNTQNQLDMMVKVRALGYLLVISGDLDRTAGNFTGAAKKYMEAIFLEQNFKENLQGIFGGMLDIYGNHGMERLFSLLNSKDANDQVFAFVKNNLNKLKPEGMEEALEDRLALNETMADEIKKMPNASNFAFVTDRERNIARGWYLGLLDQYKKEPSDVFNGVSKINKPKISMYGNILPEATNKLLESHMKKIARFNGLEVLIALQAYKKANGAYPTSLSNLMPGFLKEMPTDPFSKSGGFVYKNENGKIYLYAVGKNGADDSAHGDDVPIITPPPEKAPENKTAN